MTEPDKALEKRTESYYRAVAVIAQFLVEYTHTITPPHRNDREDADLNARSILGRLASANILICTPDELKE